MAPSSLAPVEGHTAGVDSRLGVLGVVVAEVRPPCLFAGVGLGDMPDTGSVSRLGLRVAEEGGGRGGGESLEESGSERGRDGGDKGAEKFPAVLLVRNRRERLASRSC